MTKGVKEITREMYDRAGGEDGKYLTEDDKNAIFSVADLWGYGIYGARVYQADGKYICRYERGDSCD